MKNIKASKLIFIVVCLYTTVFPQSVSVGTNIGGGVISSNSPSVGSFAAAVFVEAGLIRENYAGYRLTFLYAGDFSSLLPESRIKYSPFIKGISLKFIHSSYISEKFFFEQGLGAVTLNDRVYSDRNRWGYGFTVSLTAGKDLRSEDYSGFRIGIGTEYGLVFIPFSANYLSLYLNVGYSI